jgi:hypothetical protein
MLTFTDGKLDLNGQTLTLKGDITNTVSGGLKGSNSSNMILNGNYSPVLSFDVTTPGTTNALLSLTINSSGQMPSLGSALEIKGILDFDAGKLDIASSNLTIDPAATITGYDATNHIVAGSADYSATNGRLIRFIKNTTVTADQVFPIGTTTSYTPCYIQNTNIVGTNYKINLFDKVLTHGTNGVEVVTGTIMRTWDIVPDDEALANATTLKLQWDNADESANFQKADVEIFKNKHIAGVDEAWTLVPGVLTRQIATNPYTVSVDGITDFSNFTGNSENFGYSPLPVELVSLEATCEGNNKTEITWATATETNNSFFTLETSENTNNWTVIGTVKGAGNSNHMINYTFLHDCNGSVVKYYRLKQTDFDGKFTYSKVIKVLPCESSNTGFNVYPNPFAKEVTLFFNSETDQNVDVVVEDARGQVVFLQSYEMVKGNNKTKLNLADLMPGTYFVFLQGMDEQPYRIIKH